MCMLKRLRNTQRCYMFLLHNIAYKIYIGYIGYNRFYWPIDYNRIGIEMLVDNLFKLYSIKQETNLKETQSAFNFYNQIEN